MSANTPGKEVPRAIPMLDLSRQYGVIGSDVESAVLETLRSHQFILGPRVAELEERIAALCGCRHAIGVSSGTDALLISLMAEGIGPGDEVIVPDFSFFATAGVVSRLGATPVFVDIDPVSFNLDANRVEEALTPRTRAIIPVHLFGQMADMSPIMEVAAVRRLVVIEDAAQAIGAEIGGLHAGSIGDYGCLSFFPSKNLGCAGDGGMVVVNDEARAEKLRTLRAHGASRKYHHSMIGGNFRLDAIQAAVLLAKLPHLQAWTKNRQRNAERYCALMRDSGLSAAAPECLATGRCDPRQCELTRTGGVVLPRTLPGRTHVYNQFVIRCGPRDAVREHLAQAGIASEVYYPLPFHRQPCFEGMTGRAYPLSDCAAATTLAIPVFQELEPCEQERVVGALREALLDGCSLEG